VTSGVWSAAVLAACLAVHAAPAAAQATGRVHLGINAAYQPTAHPFADRFEFDENAETGSTTARYPSAGGVMFDGGAGVRLWKGFGLGIAVSLFSRDDEAETETSSPHPFFFDRPRQIAGVAAGLRRSERGVHAQAQYAIVSGALRALLSAGPSFLQVERDVVDDVLYDDEFPFDTATFRSARTRRANASGVGVHVGADVSWMFTRRLGVGGMLRFATASVDLDTGDDRTVAVDAGGLTMGGGVRLVF
jgi:hypothetical protein